MTVTVTSTTTVRSITIITTSRPLITAVRSAEAVEEVSVEAVAAEALAVAAAAEVRSAAGVNDISGSLWRHVTGTFI